MFTFYVLHTLVFVLSSLSLVAVRRFEKGKKKKRRRHRHQPCHGTTRSPLLVIKRCLVASWQALRPGRHGKHRTCLRHWQRVGLSRLAWSVPSLSTPFIPFTRSFPSLSSEQSRPRWQGGNESFSLGSTQILYLCLVLFQFHILHQSQCPPPCHPLAPPRSMPSSRRPLPPLLAN